MQMKEIKVKRFWRIEPIQPNEETKRVMEGWKVPKNIKLVGARIILLTLADNQEKLDLYGAVTRSSKKDFDHRDLKTDHIFYGQRDCYSRCSGMNDLVILDYLPSPYCFPVKKGEILYFKGKADVGKYEKAVLFDVLIDLMYIDE